MKRLNTIRVPVLKAIQLQVLEAKAGATERIRGRAWMTKRQRVLVRDGFACVDCGRVGSDNEIDHDVPLERGGTNDDANLCTRCPTCHQAKTAREAAVRAGRA